MVTRVFALRIFSTLFFVVFQAMQSKVTPQKVSVHFLLHSFEFKIYFETRWPDGERSLTYNFKIVQMYIHLSGNTWLALYSYSFSLAVHSWHYLNTDTQMTQAQSLPHSRSLISYDLNLWSCVCASCCKWLQVICFSLNDSTILYWDGYSLLDHTSTYS